MKEKYCPEQVTKQNTHKTKTQSDVNFTTNRSYSGLLIYLTANVTRARYSNGRTAF